MDIEVIAASAQQVELLFAQYGARCPDAAAGAGLRECKSDGSGHTTWRHMNVGCRSVNVRCHDGGFHLTRGGIDDHEACSSRCSTYRWDLLGARQRR